MWILNNFSKDLLFIIAPGLWCLALLKIIPNDSVLYTSLLVLLLTIDSSHIYSTFWRTILVKKEFNRSKILYIISPILFYLIFFILFLFFEVSFFWSLLFYASIFHQIRQNIGISKWYSKINNVKLDKIIIKFLYLLTLLPVLIFHFRPYNQIKDIFFYSPSDIFKMENLLVYDILIQIYFVLVFIYLSYEIYNLIRNKDFSRFIFNFLLITLNYFCFIKGGSLHEVLLPPLFLHGLSYLTINYISYKRINPQRLFIQNVKNKIFVVLIPLLIGSFLFYIDQNIPNPDNLINNIVFSIYILPIICHHFWDAFIWKRDHPDSHKIYNNT